MCLYGVDGDNFTFYQKGNLNYHNNSVDSDTALVFKIFVYHYYPDEVSESVLELL